MSRVQWRRFAFFEKDSVDENITDALGSTPTCASAEGGMLLFGDNDGNITLADRNFKLLWKCKAFKGEVKGVAYIYDPIDHRKQYVFAVGDEFVNRSSVNNNNNSGDDDSASTGGGRGGGVSIMTAGIPQETFYMMKVFNANDMSRPLHVFHASPGVTPTATVTAFSVLSDGCQIALGFSTGTLLLFSGNFVKSNGDGSITMVSSNRCYTPEVLLQRERQDRKYYPIASVHFSEFPTNTAMVPSGGATGAGIGAGGDRIAASHTRTNTAAAAAAAAGVRAPVDRKIRLFAVMNTDQPLGSPTANNGNNASMDRGTGSHSSLLARELDTAGIIVFDTSLTGSSAGGSGGSGVISPGLRRIPHVVDEVCGSSGGACAAYMEETRELVVARTEGVFSYSAEDRGGAAGIEGHKQCIGVIGRYVLVASVDADKHGNVGVAQRSSITIYDLRNKFVSFYYQLPQGDRVLHCLQDGNMAYIVTSSWALLRFTEKDVSSKLEVLLRKNLYSLAIALAAEEQQEVSEIMKLYKLHGDYLFKRAEYEVAMAQYMATIGYVQPSYVIKRFLDSNLMPYLVQYLEKLHDRGLASKDHTVLLLSCLTKLRDDERLLKFTNLLGEKSAASSGSSSTVGDIGAVPSAPSTNASQSVQSPLSPGFDVETAVTTLFESGCVTHASTLALKFEQHDSYIKMQLYKEEPDAAAVLAYMVYLVYRVPMETILALTLSYGADLLIASPAVFTGFLVRCCTGRFLDMDTYMEESLGRVHTPAGAGTPGAPGPQTLTLPTEIMHVDDVIALFVDDDESLLALLEGVYHISDGPGGTLGTASSAHNNINSQSSRILPAKVADTLLELYLRKYSEAESQLSALRARTAQAHDDAAESQQVDEECGRVQGVAKEMRRRITAILDNPQADYDATQALLLVHIYDYPHNEHSLLTKSSSGATSARCAAGAASQGNLLLLRKYMETNQTKRILRLLRLEGKSDSELYVQALRYFVRKQTHLQQFDDLAQSSRRRGRGPSRGDSDDDGGSGSDSDNESRLAGVNKTGGRQGVRRGSSDSNSDEDTDSDTDTDTDSDTDHSGSDSDSEADQARHQARRQKDSLKRWRDVIKVLAIIDKDKVLAPAQIIAVLSEESMEEEETDVVMNGGDGDGSRGVGGIGGGGGGGGNDTGVVNGGVPYSLIAKYIAQSLRAITEETEEAERAVFGMRATVLKLTQEEATRQQLEAQMGRLARENKLKGHGGQENLSYGLRRGQAQGQGHQRRSRSTRKSSTSSRTMHSVQRNANFNPFLEEERGADGGYGFGHGGSSNSNSEEEEDDDEQDGYSDDSDGQGRVRGRDNDGFTEYGREDSYSGGEARDSFAYRGGVGVGGVGGIGAGRRWSSSTSTSNPSASTAGAGATIASKEEELAKWTSIQKAQVDRAGEHESFFSELEQSHNGFNSVAAYFGKTSIVK